MARHATKQHDCATVMVPARDAENGVVCRNNQEIIVRALLLALTVLMAGCATTPPRPPDCEGEYTPINIAARAQAKGPDEARSGH